MSQITVVITDDTFIKGKSTPAGTELTFEGEMGAPNTPDENKLITDNTDILHLHTAGRIVEKGTKGHAEWQKAFDAKKKREAKAVEIAKTVGK